MNSLRENPNLPLIVTVILTIILMVAGVVILSKTGSKPIPDSEKQSRLVRDDSHTTGKLDAEVVLVEFSDFQCPACATYFPELEKVKTDYSDRIKFVYRHFPLSNIHPLAQKAGEASEAASSQGKFWEYHNKLFETQAEWSGLSEEKAIEQFIQFARDLDIKDVDTFDKELRDGVYAARVKSDSDDAKALNIPGTPTIFIQGEKIDNPSYENISKELDSLLTK